MKVGLIGYGKAGYAVAQVLSEDPRYQLEWIANRSGSPTSAVLGGASVPITALTQGGLATWLDQHPVDALVDFSNAASAAIYGEEVKAPGPDLGDGNIVI